MSCVDGCIRSDTYTTMNLAVSYPQDHLHCHLQIFWILLIFIVSLRIVKSFIRGYFPFDAPCAIGVFFFLSNISLSCSARCMYSSSLLLIVCFIFSFFSSGVSQYDGLLCICLHLRAVWKYCNESWYSRKASSYFWA